MSYSTPYDYNDDSIRKLDEKFSKIEVDRFLYCIQVQQKWDIEKANNFAAQISTSHTYTLKELNRLKEMEPTYNKEYSTNHRKYITTAQEVVSKMGSTLSGLKKIVSEFRDKGKKKKDVTIMDETPLFAGPYSTDCFGWDAYDDNSALKLLQELNSFLKDANECIDIAMKMIKDEIATSNSPEIAYPIYLKDYYSSVSDSRQLIKMIESQRPDLNNDFVKALEEAEDAKKLIASLFHTYNREQFVLNSACVAIHQGKKGELTKEESLIWGLENEAKVKRLRLLLDHILELKDSMEGVMGWEGKLKGHFVMRLLYWCGWNGSKNEAMLNYITKRCKGKIGVVKMGAVLTEKRKLARQLTPSADKEQQHAFNRKIDAFIDDVAENLAETN
jgi:hypothetical protein